MVADCQSRFTFLAADLLSAAAVLPTSSPKTRVGGSRRHPSGRLSRRDRCRSMFTPGLRACAYKTASGRHEWPNKDPLGEPGFELVANRSEDKAKTQEVVHFQKGLAGLMMANPALAMRIQNQL